MSPCCNFRFCLVYTVYSVINYLNPAINWAALIGIRDFSATAFPKVFGIQIPKTFGMSFEAVAELIDFNSL
ncbi:MAG: hypothetical protein AB1478_06280 [Nitrospirota bacterium]